MAALTEDERRELLHQLKSLSADADSTNNISRVFLPLPEYRRIIDDNIVLVLGERGVGKSALFHFLQTKARGALESPGGVLHDWIVGFSEAGIEHPSTLVLEELVKDPHVAEGAARAFWLGHFAGRLSAIVGDTVPAPKAVERWRQNQTNPRTWIDAFFDPTDVIAWLDQVERQFASNRVVVVTYDHLDRIGVRNREVRRRLLPPLLALWLSFSNRYRAIRAKIFLRNDLFRESVPQTSDVSKLQSRAETIRWTTSALYRLLLRHMAASGSELRTWLERGSAGIELGNDKTLGWMPPEDFGEPDQRAFMQHIVGRAMGETTDPRAGYPHRWVPAKLADANGAIVPRSMLILFASAADHALAMGPKAGYTRLLKPEEMKAGLRQTSARRVNELAEEHPVVVRLKNLAQSRLPLETTRAAELLSTSLDTQDDGFGTAGDRVLEALTDLGVVTRVRSKHGKEERIDLPEIYRLEFGIQRVGQKVRTS